MRHKSKNKTRPLFTLSLEMTRLVNETRLLLVPCFNSDIYGKHIGSHPLFCPQFLQCQHKMRQISCLVEGGARITGVRIREV